MQRSRVKPRVLLSYVIHKHFAEKLHYDLRLECGNVFKSWQVPRGLSMDPRVRRFAIEGKDAPLSAPTFEGDDAENGQRMEIWDSGSLEVSGGEEAFKRGFEKGRLTFV